MTDVAWLRHWFSGLSAPGATAETAGPVVMVENKDLAAVLRRQLAAAGPRILVRATKSDIPSAIAYRGSLLDIDAEVGIGGSVTVAVRPYGVGEFLDHASATVLRVVDDADLSAFLRDADAAWHSGIFADHVTHPDVIVADLAALGGAPGHAGPRHRMFVGPDGTISTSPTGAALGRVGSPLADVDGTWRRHNARSSAPCAVCLAQVLPERDRVDALHDRPWMRRYLVAVDAVRHLRARGHRVGRISGFGGRLTGGFGGPGGPPDPPDALLLIEVDGSWCVLEHATRRFEAVTVETARRIELQPRRAC